MSLIDSINRLERAGSEHSRATAKLHEAVCDIADLIERTVPHNVKLPRGYIVRDIESNVGTTTLLFRATGQIDEFVGNEIEECIDYDGGRYLHGDFNVDMASARQTRAKSLAFAKDVAEGLLDEIAAHLESRIRKADEATAALAQVRS